MRVLVTGAAGFIGSHAVEALVARGDEGVGLASFDDYYDPLRKRATWAELAKLPRVQLVEGDVGARAREVVERVDSVVHLAARPGVRASIDDPRRTFRENLDAFLELLEAL